MQLDKKLVAILVLSSLLMSAIGGGWYLYLQNKKIIQKSTALKVVFVAAHTIPKDQKIEKKDLKAVETSSKYILTPPLLEKEIVGKYAKVEILENDTFRKEKLAVNIVEEEATLLPFVHTSYNIAFKLFSNPNFSLKKGDHITIISVYPKENSKQNMDYAVQNIASRIKILGFLEKGKEVGTPFRKEKRHLVDKKGKKLEETEDVIVFADEMILDIEEKTLIRVIDDYNKGRQLWMVKVEGAGRAATNHQEGEIKEIAIPKISKEEIPLGKKIEKSKSIAPTNIQKTVQWYQPKSTIEVEAPRIMYADNTKVEQSGVMNLVRNDTSRCKEKGRLLIAKSSRVVLRLSPTPNGKQHDFVRSNTIIPYAQKIRDDWYEVCDGSYVNGGDVVETTLDQVEKNTNGK